MKCSYYILKLKGSKWPNHDGLLVLQKVSSQRTDAPEATLCSNIFKCIVFPRRRRFVCCGVKKWTCDLSPECFCINNVL